MIKFPILPSPPFDSDPEKLRDYLFKLVDELAIVLNKITEALSDLTEIKDGRDRRNPWR